MGFPCANTAAFGYKSKMKIEIKNIKKSFGKKHVLKNISFSLNGGECVGILGGNGCGKSTLLSILAGAVRRDAGQLMIDEKDLFLSPVRHGKLVGYVPQGTPLMEELSAKDNLRLWYDKKTIEKELSSGVLSMLGISDFLKTPVSKMSGGMKKRLSIGCAVAGRPPVLLLDEPGAALDLPCKENIVNYLRNYKAAGGAVILATHDPMELELCEKWFIITDGLADPFEYSGDITELAAALVRKAK